MAPRHPVNRRLRSLRTTLGLVACALSSVLHAQPVDAAIAKRLLESGNESGSVALAMGDAFRGPGPITIGWLGAKKQLVVPNGDWIVVGLRDFKSGHNHPVTMSSVALAQFEQRKLKSLLVASYDSKPAGANTRPTWAEVTRCDQESGAPWFEKWTNDAGHVHQCVRQREVRVVTPDDFWRGEWFAQIRRNLESIEAAPLTDRGVRTDVFMTDQRFHGVMLLSRYDFGAGNSSESERPDASRSARTTWAKAYADLAAQGYTRAVDASELEAITAAGPSGKLSLPN